VSGIRSLVTNARAITGLQFAAAGASSDIARELTWFLAMTEQIITMTPKIVDGAVDLPDCASLGALIDWRAVKQLAASLLGGHRLAVV
jgi:hypothetical protein